ncbi:tRNA (guanine-N(1)-)-methyltransferase [Methylobrevis pamukkalensis]|uniref:tRNA (Guanine-N(1)-)-methyltransferase n=1 Tax=Methylobrevis pamukkalensis TaxID=1439726 RepID=A0A1E3GYP6_9HYPH|nr:tRNA (guanine-N(1)-)-methyltransferase [Methylobrevis pamukkalensis]
MAFSASVLTLYPEMFPGPLGVSLAGKALGLGTWSLQVTQIRDFGLGRHRAVDDTPAGGGPGMVMRPDVVCAAIDSVSPPDDPRPRLMMSPRGRPLDQAFVRELAAGPGAVILCGRFEGVDERAIEARGLREVSIGDYVLSGGEPAAMVLLDAWSACCRA